MCGTGGYTYCHIWQVFKGEQIELPPSSPATLLLLARLLDADGNVSFPVARSYDGQEWELLQSSSGPALHNRIRLHCAAAAGASPAGCTATTRPYEGASM